MYDSLTNGSVFPGRAMLTVLGAVVLSLLLQVL